MSVKPSGYIWTCDWCEKTQKHESDKEAPEDWRKPKHELHRLEAAHVCSPDCEENLYKGDDIAHNLGNDLERLVRYHYGKPGINVPDLNGLTVQVEQFVEDDKPVILRVPEE